MKRLLFFTCCFILSVHSFGHCSNYSLNGYKKADVNAMTLPFNKTGTQAAQITIVWFDKNIVTNIINLLNLQVKNYHIDGTRIYFAYDNSHNETMVLVSTYDTNLSNSGFHEDYYTHDPNATLFTMKTLINGVPCHDKSCDGGAWLYQKSGLRDDAACDESNPLIGELCPNNCNE